MPIRSITRRATVLGDATPINAPCYVDSDDNKMKFIPAGSGTTEVEVVDSATAQTIAGVKTFSSPPVMSGASITSATVPVAALVGGASPVINGTNIVAGTIPAAALVNGAGIAAMVAAGLGNSANYPKTDVATNTLVAANATKDRGVIVMLIVTETYAAGTGTAPTVKVGEDTAIEAGIAAATVANKTAGTILCSGFLNTSTRKIIVTTTAAVGNGTGACTVVALALPNS